MSVITVWQGHEYRTHVSSIYTRDEFYYPQFLQAAKCIDEIAVRMDEFVKSEEDYKKRGYLDEFERYDDFTNNCNVMGYPNNIIGFCAKRGQGKSSAMLSMVSELLNKDRLLDSEKRNCEEFWNKAHKKNLGLRTKKEDSGEKAKKEVEVVSPVLGKKYYSLRSIDPTTMESNESVLEIIVKRLFQVVQSVHKKKTEAYVVSNYGTNVDYDLNDSEYRKLLGTFQDVKQRINELKHGTKTDEQDDLSSIDETGDSRITKYTITKLIRNFLEYIGKDVLIIPVDDADMVPRRVYEVVEDLRRYCVAPRVLIMMAVHLGSLKTCVEQEYVINYKYLLRSGYATDRMQKYKCREMAERYIDKLIPDLHQIHLPYIDDKVRDGENNLKVLYKNAAGEDLLDYHNPDPDTYQNQLMRLVYEKTGIILIAKPGYLHNFLPRRYRELSHMLSFFTRMEDIEISGNYSLMELIKEVYINKGDNLSEEKKDVLERRVRNLDQMENYFFQHWCPVNLTQNQCYKLDKIRTSPLSLKNKRTIEVLRAYCLSEHLFEFHMDINEKVFISTNDRTIDITFADVLDALAEVKKRLDSPFKFDFVYAIQMYYTIYMNKLMSLALLETRNFDEISRLLGRTITSLESLRNTIYKQSDGDGINSDFKRAIKSCNEEGFIIKSRYIQDKDKKWRLEPLYFFFDILDNFSAMLSKQSCEQLNPAETAMALQFLTNYDMQYTTQRNVFNKLKSYDIGHIKEAIINGIGEYKFSNVFEGKQENEARIHCLPLQFKKEVLQKSAFDQNVQSLGLTAEPKQHKGDDKSWAVQIPCSGVNMELILQYKQQRPNVNLEE